MLKMRGSDQDKALREFTITNSGLKIGEPFAPSEDSLLGLAAT